MFVASRTTNRGALGGASPARAFRAATKALGDRGTYIVVINKVSGESGFGLQPTKKLLRERGTWTFEGCTTSGSSDLTGSPLHYLRMNRDLLQRSCAVTLSAALEARPRIQKSPRQMSDLHIFVGSRGVS
jgi:hypothetical protein